MLLEPAVAMSSLLGAIIKKQAINAVSNKLMTLSVGKGGECGVHMDLRPGCLQTTKTDTPCGFSLCVWVCNPHQVGVN